MLKNFFRTAFLIVSISLFFSQTAMSGVFNAKTFTLKNGLQVFLIENHIAPIITFQMCVKVGCADDPCAVFALSHFLEHMMFKGTRKTPGDDFNKMIQEEGGETNAFTSYDWTAYVTTLSAKKLNLILEKEADRLQNLNLRKKDVVSEREVVQEERRMRFENNPVNEIKETLRRVLYWHHPYGTSLIGYAHHIASYTREAALTHYKTWYCPNNTILIISGDTTLEQLKPLVEKHFGPIPENKNLPKRKRCKEPDHQGVTSSIEQENPRIEAINYSIYYRAPSYASKHFFPLLVLEQIMGGNALSRLYDDLVEEKKIALSVGCGYDDDTLDANSFSFSVVLAQHASLEAVKSELHQHIRVLLDKGITADELIKAKRDLLAHFAFARDGNMTSVVYFRKLVLGLSLEDIENWPELINKVTKKEIEEAVQTWFSGPPLAVLTLYPKGKRLPFLGKAEAKSAEKACA